MGMQPMVSSPYGNGPDSLAPATSPAPPAPDLGGVNQTFKQIGEGTAPGMAAPPAPEAGQNSPEEQAALDEVMGMLGGQGPGVATNAETGAMAIENSDMSPMPAPEGVASLREQARESFVRLKNAFTVTAPESLAVIKRSGMFEDARYRDGILEVKRPGRQGFEKFDRDKLELIGDTLDMARDGVEGLIENAGRLGGGVGGAAAGAAEAGTVGAAAGSVVPGPGTVLGGAAGVVSGGIAGAVPGAIVGGAAGAAGSKMAGDFIAQQILGIPQDPERNLNSERIQAGAMGAGLSFVGSRIARRYAMKQAARTEATRTFNYATKLAGETAQDVARIAKSGIQMGEDGVIRLDPNQLTGGAIPELKATAKELSTSESFRNAQRELGDKLQTGWNSIANALGANVGSSDIGEKFVLSAETAHKSVGKLIGDMRQLAVKELVSKRQPAPQFFQTLQIAKEHILSPGHAERQLGLTPAQAKNYFGVMNKFAGLVKRTDGAMQLDTAIAIQENLTKQINSHIDSVTGRPYALALIDLRNAIASDAVGMMEHVLPPDKMEAFAADKARYADLSKAAKMLGQTLENEGISRNALVGRLFEGKDSYKFAASAKTIMDMSNPKLWNQLSGEYFQKAIQDATDPVSKNVNWGQIAKKWTNLDDRTKQIMLAGAQIPADGVRAFLNVATQVQGTSFEALANETTQSKLKAGIKGIFNSMGGMSAKGTAFVNMFNGMGKDQAVVKWLQDGALENILKEMPGLKPDLKSRLRDSFNSWVIKPIEAKAGPAVAAKADKAAGLAAETYVRGKKTSLRRATEDTKGNAADLRD